MSKLQNYLTEAGVPAELHAEALASLQSARKPALIRFWLGLTAPIVWLLIAAFLPRKAEQLPKWLRWYDNNINLNGDRAEWARLGEGAYVRLPNPNQAGINSTGKNYSYLPPFSPRAFGPRWVFNGIRNRCSYLIVMWGKRVEFVLANGIPIEQWGNPATSRTVMGLHVVRHGDIWQLRRTSAQWGGVKIEGYGYEILNCNEIDRIATLTWTPWSWKGRKK